jgi:hypothetical protein
MLDIITVIKIFDKLVTTQFNVMSKKLIIYNQSKYANKGLLIFLDSKTIIDSKS